MPSLDLAIIIPFLEKYGGAERYLIECIRYWQERHQITIYSTSFSERLLKEHGISSGVKRVQLTPYFEGEHAILLNSVLLPSIWREEIGRHDLYHTHLWPTHLINRHPMVWFPHEPFRALHDLRYEHNYEKVGKSLAHNIHIYPKFNYDRIGDHIYEAYFSSINAIDKSMKPDRIVANSHYTARYLEQVYNHPVKDIVYPGVAPESFIDLPIDRNLFVTISQLWPHKRVNLLLESIALTDEAQLVVIGTGPEESRLKEIAFNLGIEDRVFFLSNLNNQELRLILARACAFVFSPIKEPFGIVVLEAMAAGLPVIAVSEGGYTEVCNPKNSFLVKPYPSIFAEKISFLQQNPDIAKKMGKVGQRNARQFTWERTASKLETIIIDTWKESISKKVIKSSSSSLKEVLVGIQYYLWYEEGYGSSHWNDNTDSGHIIDKPFIGFYSSAKGQTIEYHLDLFEHIGLDYVILNLHIDHNGPNGFELISIQNLFDIAEKRNSSLKFSIQVAPYTDDISELEKVLNMIKKIFSDHPNYFKLDDKPVLFWFWSSAYDYNYHFINSLATMADHFININN